VAVSPSLSDLPQPPAEFSPSARNAWHRLHALQHRQGRWRDMYRLDIDSLAHACGWYLDAARAMHALTSGHPRHPQAAAALEAGRRRARAGLVEWGWLPPERYAVRAVDAAGIDADLAALCAPPG
jgi:hypothetical protein